MHQNAQNAPIFAIRNSISQVLRMQIRSPRYAAAKLQDNAPDTNEPDQSHANARWRVENEVFWYRTDHFLHQRSQHESD